MEANRKIQISNYEDTLDGVFIFRAGDAVKASARLVEVMFDKEVIEWLPY